MKKFLSAILALSMAFGLVACGGSPASSSSSDSTSDSSSEMSINYGAGLTEDGYFEDVDLEQLIQLPENYKSLSIATADVQPTEEEWNYYRASIASQAGTKVNAEDGAEAQLGQFVSVDFSGSVNGEDFVGGSGQNVEILLGGGNFLEDLENGIVGHKSGDVFDVEVTFPEGYGTTTTVEDEREVDLGGQTAVFSVILNSVYNYEMNDEQIATYFSSVNETLPEEEKVVDESTMRTYFNENMYRSNLQKAVVNALKESTEFEVPQSVTDSYVQVELEIAELNAYSTGRELEELLNLSGYPSQEDFEEAVANSAQEDLKTQCLLLAVAKAEGIEYDDDSCVEAFGYGMSDLIAMYGYTESYVRQNVLCYKALNFLTDSAVIA